MSIQSQSPTEERRLAVVHGPNLNMLGLREPQIYGRATLEEINERLREFGEAHHARISTFQSNHEGELIDYLHSIRGTHEAVIINPGGLTHTSVSLRDALASTDLPIYEVHLSNVYQREAFRHHSYVSGIAVAVICGAGALGYELAVLAALDRLRRVPSA